MSVQFFSVILIVLIGVVGILSDENTDIEVAIKIPDSNDAKVIKEYHYHDNTSFGYR